MVLLPLVTRREMHSLSKYQPTPILNKQDTHMCTITVSTVREYFFAHTNLIFLRTVHKQVKEFS